MEERIVKMERRLGGIVAAMALIPLLTAATSVAQVKPGAFRVAAGIGGFSYSNLDVEGVDIETTEFSIGPSGNVRVGYVATELFEVGVNFSVSHVDLEVEDVDTDATSWLLGPYAELNFPINEDGTAVFAPGLGLAFTSTEGEGFDLEAFGVTLAGTLKYFLADSASIDVGLQFTYVTGDADVDGGGDWDADGFIIGPRVGISIWP